MYSDLENIVVFLVEGMPSPIRPAQHPAIDAISCSSSNQELSDQEVDEGRPHQGERRDSGVGSSLSRVPKYVLFHKTEYSSNCIRQSASGFILSEKLIEY